jgi:hypothetical protein
MPIFREVAGLDGVWTARSGKLGCAAIRLSGGDLCLYSPVLGLGDKGVATLREHGEVSILLAPNHYHNRGLAEHVRLFPEADLVSSTHAETRLAKQTGLQFKGLDTLSAGLPKNIRSLEPKGLKTGEIWLQIEGAEDLAWIVCDAFSSPLVKDGAYAEGPSMLGTFPKFGVRDRKMYTSWVKSQISRQPPTILIPCHGAPVRRTDLAELLSALLDKGL